MRFRWAAALVLASGAAFAQEFANFESPWTHPIAISPDGARLFVVNTPDHRLSVWSLARPDAPELECEIPVGLEPVAVAIRDADEAWVVNRMSDSVSVVSLSLRCVVATLAAGDEPADVVFAGAPARAFVSVASDRQVRVFDAERRALRARIDVFGDEPRALAAARDGGSVWVAALRSGNGTTIVPEEIAPPPPPPERPGLPSAPRQGLIVRADDPEWRDRLNVRLPDLDVFEIDPATCAVRRAYAGVGTLLFGIAEDPDSGDLWVANTEARNLVRFEPNLRGHVVDHRVTRIVRADRPRIEPHDLNPGVDYSLLPNDAARARALAQPTDLCITRDGERLYVAAFGSDRIGVLDREGAVRGAIDLATAADRRDARRLRGPRGLALHPEGRWLYVANRVAHSLAVIDTERGSVAGEQPIGFDPTPAAIAQGRGFLYSAELSGNGTVSCAVCHVDGDWDGLAWDLGDPRGEMETAANREIIDLRMHPMKGPMTTQTLRGLTPKTAPFHRRGDRARLLDFNVTFAALHGTEQLAPADMGAFALFLESIVFPPNPHRNLDRTLPPPPRGAPSGDALFRVSFNGSLSCAHCHGEAPGTNGIILPGPFLQYQAQPMKIPQLRDVYKRTARIPRDGLRMSGFGIFHDGSVDRVADFLTRPFFRGIARLPDVRAELERFVLGFDTGTAPAVGWSRTVRRGEPAPAELELVGHQAALGSCDLVAKGRVGARPRGFVFDPVRCSWTSDAPGAPPCTSDELLAALGPDDALTFLGVPPGSGRRIGIDRDGDGEPDGARETSR
jgi:DNA-binding beta-propeller fold protein YncE